MSGYSERRFGPDGQRLVEETGSKVRAVAVRSHSNPSDMLGDVGKVFATLSKYEVRFLGTGSTHHCVSGRRDADIAVLFECSDQTYAKIFREPDFASAKELDPHMVMRHLDADVMDASRDDIAALRTQYRANIIERLLLDCTPTSLHRVTKHLTRFHAAITGVKKPERKVQREEIVPYRIYVQNIRETARATLGHLMQRKNILGGWSNKTTVRLQGNAVTIQRLEDDLRATFTGKRLDRMDIGPVSAVIRDDDRQPTVRVSDVRQ